MARLHATAVRSDSIDDETVTIELGYLEDSALEGAKTRALVACDFFRQVWFADEYGNPTFVVKDNLGTGVPRVEVK